MMFTLFCCLLSASAEEVAVVEGGEAIEGQSFGLLRELFMPYGGGMYGGGMYGNNMGMYGGGYGSSMGGYNQGNNYSSSTGWDRGYNNVNANSYNQGGYGSMGANQYGMYGNRYGMYLRRLEENEDVRYGTNENDIFGRSLQEGSERLYSYGRTDHGRVGRGLHERSLQEDVITDLPDGFLTPDADVAVSDPAVEADAGALDADGVAVIAEDMDEVIDGQTHHHYMGNPYYYHRSPSYYPRYGFGYRSYSQYSPYAPYSSYPYHGFPGYPMFRGGMYRRLSAEEDTGVPRNLRGNSRQLEDAEVVVLPELPVADNSDHSDIADDGHIAVHDEAVAVAEQVDSEVTEEDEEIDGQHHHRRRRYYPAAYPVAYPVAQPVAYPYPVGGGGGMYSGNAGMYGGGYGSSMGGYNQGNNYSSSTGWDRGYNNVNANSYNQGGYGSMGANQYGMYGGANAHVY